MADETRRSGRANKGHHSHKDKEITDATPQKTKKGKKGSKNTKSEPSDDEQSEDIIRCICGATTDEQDGSTMIQCDNCDAWQHNICMGIKKGAALDQYYCERCKPEQHQELWRLVNEDKRAFLEIAAERIAAAPKNSRKPKLPEGYEHYGTKIKGRKSGRLSEGNVGASEDSAPQQASPPPAEPKTGTKRQLPVDEPAQNGGHAPVPSDSATATPTASAPKRVKASGKASESTPAPKKEPKSEPGSDEPADQPNKLPNERRKPTEVIATVIAEKIGEFAKDSDYSDEGAFQIPEGETAKSLGIHYAMGIEHAMWNHFGMIKGAYGEQFRAIRANMKKNPDLVKRLLLSTLEPSDFPTLSSDDMADEETRRKDAIARELAEKQAFAIVDEGPRIVSDHKGLRYVGGEDTEFQTFSNSATGTGAYRRESVMSNERPPTSHSHEAGSPMQVEPSENAPASDRPALSVNTSGQQHSPSARRSSSNAQEFDIKTILQKTPVISQNTGLRPLQHPPRRRTSNIHRQSGQHEQPQNIDDPDVDRLLMDDGAESAHPIYSTGAVWSGHVHMMGVTDFQVHAMQVAGADYKEELWHRGLLKSLLNITGRISVHTADEYVLGMKHSTTKDVVVLSLLPDSEEDTTALNQVYQYCKDKERWGVVHNDDIRNDVHDAYIIPVEAGSGPLPAFLEALDNVRIEQPRKDKLLLLALIVKHQRSPTSSQALATPVRPTDTPVAPPYSATGFPPPEMAVDGTPSGAPSQTSQDQSQDESLQLARQVLGDMLSFPIFSHPMMKVSLPTMSLHMLENLRDLLQDHPECRSDLMKMSATLNQLSLSDPPAAA